MADFAILVLTLRRRRAYLARLMRRLEPQLCSRCRVFTYDEHEELPIGHRRQILLERIRKKPYVAFIDDDDLVAENYVSVVLDALEHHPDVVGFRGLYYEDGERKAESVFSVRCKMWDTRETPLGTVHLRTPNHLCPVRRRIALEIGFPPIDHGEDADYSMRLMKQFPNLRETFINDHLYTYLFRSPARRCESEFADVI